MPKKKKSEKLVRVFWMIEPKQKELIEEDMKEQKYASESALIRDLLDRKYKL